MGDHDRYSGIHIRFFMSVGWCYSAWFYAPVFSFNMSAQHCVGVFITSTWTSCCFTVYREEICFRESAYRKEFQQNSSFLWSQSKECVAKQQLLFHVWSCWLFFLWLRPDLRVDFGFSSFSVTVTQMWSFTITDCFQMFRSLSHSKKYYLYQVLGRYFKYSLN